MRAYTRTRSLVFSALLSGSMLCGEFAMALPAQAQVSVDSSTLVTYTGTGWDMSVPPGWGPVAALGPGWVGGVLPDGKTSAAILIKTGDAQGQGLDVLAPAFVKGLGSDAKLGPQAPTSIFSQSAVSIDFSVGSGANSTIGRAYVWIEDGTYVIAGYLAVTSDPAKAGLDMFRNQLLSTLEYDLAD